MSNNDTTAAATSAFTTASTASQPRNINDMTNASRKTFDGAKSTDAAQWLRVYERRSRRLQLSDLEMVEDAVCLLEDAAEKWYMDELERGKISPEASWAQWKNAFISKYVEVETIDELMDRLLNVKQAKWEAVEDYGTRVADLVRKVGSEVTTRTVLSVFKKGLQLPYQVELEKSEHKTLEEALNIVTKKEKLSKIEKKVISEEKDVVKLSEEMEIMKLRLMNAEAVAKKNNGCYTCFETGHTSKDCPVRGKKGIKKVEKAKENTKGELRRMEMKTGNVVGEDDWSRFIDPMVFAYRMRVNKVTGKSPYEMLYGVSPKLSKWVMKDYGLDVTTTSNEEIEEIRKFGVKENQSIEPQFEINDLVMLKDINPSKLKLNPKWKGYYKIVAVGPNNSYQLGGVNGKNYQIGLMAEEFNDIV